MQKFVYDLQVWGEIFTLICILQIYIWTFWAFLTSENDVTCTVTLRRLTLFWRIIVRYNIQKELFSRVKGIFSLGKVSFLFPATYTKISVKIVIYIIIS